VTWVDIDGTSVNSAGSIQVCPTVTKKYTLTAHGQGGDANRNLTILVTTQPTTQPAASAVINSFQNKDIVNIAGNIFVIVSGQRRQVPNPETLDALGISRTLINNKGFSDTDLLTISKGSDIPDVNRDYSGFMNFKDVYFPNTIPIISITPTQTQINPNTLNGINGTNGSTIQNEDQTESGHASLGDGYDPGISSCSDGFSVCAGSSQDLFYPGQCTYFVAGIRQDVQLWIGDAPRNAYLWSSRAQQYGGKYGVIVGSEPILGDIAVWQANCHGTSPVPANGPCIIGSTGYPEGCGHVAYVTWVSDDNKSFTVEEQNWQNRKEPILVDPKCMNFIHLPNQSGQNQNNQSSGESSVPNKDQQISNNLSTSPLGKILNWFMGIISILNKPIN
jgi:surface antigen